MKPLVIPNHLEIKDTIKGKGVFTKIPIGFGEIAMHFDRPIVRPNRLAKITAIQIDVDSYLDAKHTEIRDFLNHSCNPNCRIDVIKMQLIAIKEINPNEEITFNYCSTEFDLQEKNESFTCMCDSANCLKVIKGFNHLTEEQKNKIQTLLVPYLIKKL